MINLLKSLIITLGVLFVLFISLTLIPYSNASEFHVIELNELILDYKNFEMVNNNARNLLLYPEPPKEGINLNINLNVLKFGFWDSQVESMTTHYQFRSIGLQYQLGVHLFPIFDVMLYHHSQHLMEKSHSFIPSFPEEDAVEFRLYLYRKNKEPSIFGR